MKKKLEEFGSVLPNWYDRSTQNEYYRGWVELLDYLPLKAERCGYFDIDDLSTIADWGGQSAWGKTTTTIEQHTGTGKEANVASDSSHR